ncbi:integrin alpha-IIb [Hemicordylus capensis]|uniref:integrin alpha-IIb n=1 Tax=Hemicordylus capensis TaxID=884348 RepID=UPI0023040F24|nr:integrin alpha-IIb [Hemicordylus capensis]
MVGLLLLSSLVWTLNLNVGAPTLYSGPKESYFGFALDFYRDNSGSMSVVVGAPRANTSQPNVPEAGYVYLCPWAPNGSSCSPIGFDSTGDQEDKIGTITVKTFKTKQWFGASVNTWKDNIMACAPLQHWNAFDDKEDAMKTPVGSCFVASTGQQHIVEYSPCRQIKMRPVYKATYYQNDNRYCEIGFSAAISNSGRLLLGAPGGYYFGGLIYSVNLSAVQQSFPSTRTLLWPVKEALAIPDYTGEDYDDAYRGYSVAFGEFNEDPKSPEYVVGIPNKRQTQGAVEIFSENFRVLWTLSSEQVASYFGHTVAVADVNGDGKDDVLVGAPLFLERRSDHKFYEVGRVYLYLQQKTHRRFSTPQQKLTGTDVFGRFGMAISSLGDVDQDGYTDIAIGAPYAGQNGRGRVYIYCGHNEGLSASPNQILESPFGHVGFGFAIRGDTDIDANGYPDVLVGAYGASKVAVYRAQPVVKVKAQLVMPDALNPEEKTCMVSREQVSCFPIQMCVDVSGGKIPQKIVLDAELQLDCMKQKFGRRVFLQPNWQPSWTFSLSEKHPEACQNVTAYLQNEADFKDKLSPIVVSLNFSLASTATAAAAGELQPVLYGQTMLQKQTRIILDCGEDNVCIPDLQISAHTNEAFLLIGAENVVLIQVTAMNKGEGAYEAELVVELPRGAYFQRANSAAQKLICNSRKENETRLVACEVGNPMKSGTEIKVGVELGVSHLEEAGDAITFTLQLRSKNSHNSNSNITWLQVPINANATMKVLGNSAPAVIVLPPILKDYNNGSMKGNDHGPKVEHIYQLQNEGPSTISGAELLIGFPRYLGGDLLLYIARITTEGNITCSSPNLTNPLKEPTTAPSYNATARPWRWRERRDVTSEAEPSTLQEPTVLNCSSQDCVDIHCQVGSLEKSHGVTVSIHAVLWLQTFQERPLEQFRIQSQTWFRVLGMPYHVQPETLPAGTSLASTLVERVNPDAERHIPVWWIIGAVLSGLLLLATLIIIFWKIGFFKRMRPPTEEEEELTNDPRT